MTTSIRVLCLLTLSAVSQPSNAIDFLQALELAQQSDPDILAAEYEYQGILETRPQSKSALLPSIDFSIYKTHTNAETENSSDISLRPNGSTSFDTDGYSLSLNQTLYNHGIYKTLQQTDINIAAATANIEATRQTLIVRVADAYFNVLGAQDNLKFARAEKKAIGQQLEQTQKRFDVGLIAITDVKESQARYDVSVADEIEAKNLLETTRETLRSIIGEAPESLNILTETMPLLIPEPANIDQWTDTARKNNLQLQAAKFAFQAAQKQIDIDKSNHYPSLGLVAQHNYTSPDGGSSVISDTTDTSIMVQLSVPIYSGGLTSAKTRQAIANKEKARALQNRALRQTVQQSRESYLGVTTSIAQVKAFKQALISTQTAHEATQAGFEVGTRTSIDVLSSLREQYRAERDYARTRYTYILNSLRLKQAAGILSMQDVVKINQWLEH
ncbi:MAG: TolC family outer membrane protein [Gammaproteobacteria bacterium]|nr:TolC family outer membrane protein [Gammaproteobacteria bacterium]